MRHTILFLLAIFVGSFAVTSVGMHVAHADTTGGGSGSSTAIAPPVALPPASPPSAMLHDPTSDPVAAYDDAKAAKKAGWPALVLVLLIFATKALSYVGGKLSPVGKWLAAGKHAVYVAVAGTLLASAYNAVALGGSLWAAGLAILYGLLAVMSPHAPASAEFKQAVA